MEREFKFIDLFAGIGGFRLAMDSMGGKCVFSSEWDKNAQDVYEKNHGHRPAGDITKIHENDIPDHDVLCAGFPCQAFSIAGKRKGFEDTRGTLFFDIARIVKAKSPKILILENVKNLLTHDKGNTFSLIKKTLEDMNYTVNAKVLKSSDFGLPQARERVFIVCIKDFTGEFEFPVPMKKVTRIKDILIKLSKEDTQALKIQRDDISFYRNEKELVNPRKALQIGKINKGGQGERIYSVYGSGITLSAYGGGAAAKTGAYKVGNIIRKLHPKECLALQGFPKSFKLHPSYNISYQQLGNSVSVDVIKKVMSSVLKSLDSQFDIAA